MTIHPEKLLHEYTITIERKSYKDAKISDVFAGHVIKEKSRKLKSAIEIVIEGTELTLEDCAKNKQKACFVAVGIKQRKNIRGLQNGFPRTQLRRRNVSYFFPNTPQLIPDSHLLSIHFQSQAQCSRFLNLNQVSVRRCTQLSQHQLLQNINGFMLKR